MLCTVHILYGKSTVNYQPRVDEITALAKFLKKRAKDETAMSNNLILLGDFNIFKPTHKTFNALVESGFTIPKALLKSGSNVKQNKHFDQIAFMTQKKFQIEEKNAGVFNFFKHVYREDEADLYKEQYHPRWKYNNWRTHQMSDHYPMWVELKVEFGGDYLREEI